MAAAPLPLTPPMDTPTTEALSVGGICDITTFGAKTGSPHRIEIVFHHFDGEHFITGKPGFKRDWLANLRANPEFILHLKRGGRADLDATATPITDATERAQVLYRILTESWGNPAEKANHILDRWVHDAPLVKFQVFSS